MEARLKKRLRVPLYASLCLGVLIITAVLAQIGGTTPLNPLTLRPQTIRPEYVWNAGVYGVPATDVYGNSTAIGSTLLLNTINTNNSATVTYTLNFLDLKDLAHYDINYTLYVPGSLVFASSSTPLRVLIAGDTFLYYPTQPENFSWYANNPAYVPKNSDLVHTPTPQVTGGGNYLYIPFNFQSSTLALDPNITVSISVPAHGQIYIPRIILSASANFVLNVPNTSRLVGLITLPFTIGAAIGIYFFLRQFGAWKYAGTLALAFCLRVGLAPLLMHSDVSTLARFAELYFNYHLFNLQTWSYGLVWFASIVLAVSPSYTVGVAPSFAEWDLLLKLPGIAADLLTFLVIIRILTPKLGEGRAYTVAAFGWLFNPLVVYFSSVHGLGESVVALFIAMFVYFLMTGRKLTAISSAAAAVVTLVIAAVIVPPIVVSRSFTAIQKALLVALPVVSYVAVFVLLYHSPNGLLAYFEKITSRTSPSTLPLGVSSTSLMTYLFLPYFWLGIYVSPALGIAAVVGASALLWLRGIETVAQKPLLVTFACFSAFYFTYEVFYVQHVVWAMPLLVCLLALAPGAKLERAIGFVLGFSFLALLINFGSYYEGQNRIGLVSPSLSMVLFTLMLVPILLWLPLDWIRRLQGPTPTAVVRAIAVILALFLTLIWATSGHNYAGLAVVAALCAIVFAVLAQSPSNADAELRTNDALVLFALVIAIGTPIYLLYASSSTTSPVDAVVLLGLALCALWELLRVSVAFLRPQGLTERPFELASRQAMRP
jgi:hypothetical protein